MIFSMYRTHLVSVGASASRMEDLDFCGGPVIRKRGRPLGKMRVPLNKEQKKARNAKYERERRNEIAEATCQLAEAAGFDQSVSVANLLTSVIDVFKENRSRNSSDTIEVLKQRNEDMEKEIKELTQFLSQRIDNYEIQLDDDPYAIEVNKRGVKRKSLKSIPNGTQKKQRLQSLQQDKAFKIETDIDLKTEIEV